MYKFNEENFLEVASGAVSLRNKVESIVDEVTQKGYKNLFLIGSGGSYAAMFPFDFALKMYSSLPVYNEIASEFILMDHKHFGKDSLVIFSSLSGTTKETIEAAKYCKEKGATTIGLTGKMGSPLDEITDHTLINYAEDDTAPESINMQLYMLVYGLMYKRNEYPRYPELMEALSETPKLLVNIREQYDEIASDFATKHKDTKYHMIVGAGTLWGWAYNYSMCILEEMQWIHTTRVHASEFFHGSLELVEEDTSIILLEAEDVSRPLTDRVRNFAEKYTSNLFRIDTREFNLPGMDDELRKELAPLLICAVFDRLNVYLEKERNHPLSTRRYYRKVAY